MLLFTRPRRFGKTLFLSTLQAFVERGAQDHEALFGDLAIWNDPVAREHVARYPVVFLTLKDLKHSTWEKCLESIGELVAEAFETHRDARAVLSRAAADPFDAIRERRASEVRLEGSPAFLCKTLHQHHGERVVLLID